MNYIKTESNETAADSVLSTGGEIVKLKFGTSGVRNLMNDEPDGMNVPVVKRLAKGLGAYLLKKSSDGNAAVVIGCDSRNNSRLFAQTTAETLVGMGISAKIFPYIVPVPMLSFAVRELGADAGVMITASHNPKEYNGFKVYNRFGNQITDDEAHAIENEINSPEICDVKPASSCGITGNTSAEASELPAAGKTGICEELPQDFMEKYLSAVMSIENIEPDQIDRNLRIVYTPLNGAGKIPVTTVLDRLGLNYTVVKEQAEPDGNFPTCPYPNPERTEVFNLAAEYARETGADVILATDPDSDRLGVAVRTDSADCSYRVLTGNEVGTILTKFLLDSGAKGNTIITSIVSTPIIEKLAASFGKKTERKLVGFKYIGERMNEIGEDFLFGFEESNGYLAGSYTRDKDAVCGTMLVACASGYYKSRGKSLLNVLEDVYEEYGNVVDMAVSIKAKSEEEKKSMMAQFRSEDACGRYVQTDYASGIDGLPPANMIIRDYPDGARVIIRPSGTEPKIKIYIYAESEERGMELEAETHKKKEN